MICPKCRSALISCVDSRQHNETIRRRRKCMVCGCRFTTTEIRMDDYHELKSKEALLADVLAYVADVAEKVKGNKK